MKIVHNAVFQVRVNADSSGSSNCVAQTVGLVIFSKGTYFFNKGLESPKGGRNIREDMVPSHYICQSQHLVVGWNWECEDSKFMGTIAEPKGASLEAIGIKYATYLWELKHLSLFLHKSYPIPDCGKSYDQSLIHGSSEFDKIKEVEESRRV